MPRADQTVGDQDPVEAQAARRPVSHCIRVNFNERTKVNDALLGGCQPLFQGRVGFGGAGPRIVSQDKSQLPPFEEHELDDPQLLISAAAEVFQMRRARDRVMPAGLTGEPAWDLLLALYIELPVGLPVSSACYAAGVANDAGLRWIAALEKSGLVERQPDDRDGTVNFVSLSKDGRLVVERSLKAMLRAAGS